MQYRVFMRLDTFNGGVTGFTPTASVITFVVGDDDTLPSIGAAGSYAVPVHFTDVDSDVDLISRLRVRAEEKLRDDVTTAAIISAAEIASLQFIWVD